MRPLRPLSRVDARRAAYRRRYANYMTSPAWWVRRERWYRDQILLTGQPPTCAVCRREWTLANDLHHTSYVRLGHEHHTDLVLNRPGMSGDSVPWEGWSHAREYVEEVPGRAA